MEFKKALKNNNCGLLIVQVLYIVQRYSDSPIKRLETVFYYHQPLGREIVSGKIQISILSCLLVLVEVVCAVANGFKNVCSDCIKLLLLQFATTVEKPAHELCGVCLRTAIKKESNVST